MSTNCLVKKAKVSVNDNNLPFLGYIKVYFDTVENASNLSNGLRKYGDMFKDGIIKVKGNIYFANSSLESLGVQERESTSQGDIYVTNGSGVLLLSDTVKNIISIAGAGDVNKGYYVKLYEFRDITTLENITIVNSTRSEGDLLDLAQCVSINMMQFRGTAITGNMKDFAISQIDDYGRVSGTCLIKANSGMIVHDTFWATSGVEYTITYTDSTHFSIASAATTFNFVKSDGVWSIVS